MSIDHKELQRALNALFYDRWGHIWWFPAGARLYGRFFRWMWRRPGRHGEMMWLYRPMAWLYNHWWQP